ncbi:hypothetical protein SAMD00023353_1002040 [Rosellinia necatrix]|uniref:Fucose-specific lectin n=1 Tax=Rosellinia necatrix TaxID=77044 RepID=A0A1W2TBM0_ROSNE|nr:hypothetical protein SAMD00023353_1002040 [Rosellinia necatrix]
MSLACAFAAALNPAKKEEIFIWYLKDGCAQVERKAVRDFLDEPTSRTPASVRAETDDDFVAAADAAAPNYEPFSSCVNFGCAAHETAMFVFGIRDDKAVCMVSPTYCKLAKKAVATEYTIAACARHKQGTPGALEKVSVFYIEKPTNENVKVKQFDLDTRKYSTLVASPNQDSQLCATYMVPVGHTTKVPFVFYQRGTTIVEHDTVNKIDNVLTKISGIPKTTPLATCEFQNSTFLFWLSSGFVLMYCRRQDGKWGQATAVPANPGGSEPQIADTQSDLAVVAYPAKNCILIYYLAKDSEQDYDYFTWKEPS